MGYSLPFGRFPMALYRAGKSDTNNVMPVATGQKKADGRGLNEQ
jgi:hypothetical protein